MFFRRQREAEWIAVNDAAERCANSLYWDFCLAATALAFPEQRAEEFCSDFETAMRTFALVKGFTRRDVENAFRRLVRKAHPDVGGNREAFQALVAQRDVLLSYADWAHSLNGANG